MAAWSLADVPVVELDPGESVTTAVTGTIPTIGPGDYLVTVEGSGPGGRVGVLQPPAP